MLFSFPKVTDWFLENVELQFLNMQDVLIPIYGLK